MPQKQEKDETMNFRKLENWEHENTRALYELVFSEDEQSFVDYYYKTRARENQIYGAEDESGIHGMLHLNPCRVLWNGEELVLWYVVAVATEPDYRHKGLMRSLLTQALKDLEQQGASFVFLMPASEAIYTPFGFGRAWPWQWEEDRILNLLTKGMEPGGIRPENWKKADRELLEDQELLERLSEKVNQEMTSQFQLFSKRSPDYYRRLAQEQEVSGGSLEILFGAQRSAAMTEEAEAVGKARKGQKLSAASEKTVEAAAGGKDAQPLCARCEAREAFPPMMARITNLEAFITRVRAKERVTKIWYVTDALLPQNQGLFELTVTPQGGQIRRLELLAAEEARIETVDIADLPARLGAANPFCHTMICEVV